MEIPFAICSDGEYIYANELTEKQRELSRRQPNTYICPECGTYLTIGVKKRYYFSHKRNQSCSIDLKGEYQNYRLQQSHESKKHKFLKNKLREKLELSDDPLIDKNTICIEKYTNGRRADVYCERKNKPIAFEIQISPLSLSIILARIDDYQNNGIFLFWIIELSPFDIKRFQTDIALYGLSNHIYEISSNDKLLKYWFESPKIYYTNGFLSVKREQRFEFMNLSNLKIVNNQPILLNYENEEKQLRKIITVLHESAKSLDKSRLQAIDDKLDQLKNIKPLLIENFDTIKKILSWLKQYPNLLSKTVFQATRIVDFLNYIEEFHKNDNYIDKDCGDEEDKLKHPIINLPCPICISMDCGYRGYITIQNNKGTCEFCKDEYKNIDLIQYIADMRHSGNKFKAAQEICNNYKIPYKS